MNLIITDKCNRSCPYCFAQEQMSKSGSFNFISQEDYDYCLNFLSASGYQDVRLLGGEPSIHSEFTTLIDSALNRDMHVTIFTNGLWPKKVSEYFLTHGFDNVDFVFNINNPTEQKNSETQKQHNNLKIAGSRAKIGFNIYRDNFDLLFVNDLIDKYGLQRIIRLGLANPIVNMDNQYLGESKLKKIGERLLDQLSILEQNDILGVFDCGFTICMFPPDRYGDLHLCTPNGFRCECGPVFDVGPDLSIWHCFPLSGIGRLHLRDFSNAAEVLNFYNKKIKPLEHLLIMDQCRTCKYLRRGQCTGGCLGRRIRKWRTQGDPQILQKLDSMLSFNG